MEQLVERTPDGILIALLVAMTAAVAALTVQIVRGRAALKTKLFDITPVVQSGDGRANLQTRLNAMHKAMWLIYGMIRERHPSYQEMRRLEFMLDCERYFTSRILLNHITVDDEYVDNVYNDVKAMYIRDFRDEASDGRALDEAALKGVVRATLHRIKGDGGKK